MPDMFCIVVLVLPAVIGVMLGVGAFFRRGYSLTSRIMLCFYCIEPAINMPLVWWRLNHVPMVKIGVFEFLAAPLPVAVLLLLWLVPRPDTTYESDGRFFLAWSGTVRLVLVVVIFAMLNPFTLSLALLVGFAGWCWLFLCLALAHVAFE